MIPCHLFILVSTSILKFHFLDLCNFSSIVEHPQEQMSKFITLCMKSLGTIGKFNSLLSQIQLKNKFIFEIPKIT